MCGYFCIRFIDFMLAGKTVIDYTNLFSSYDFNKNDSIILYYNSAILKMHEIDKIKLTDQTKFRLYEMKKVNKVL